MGAIIHDIPAPVGDQWPSDWLRATLGLFVLRALEAAPSYGYAIIRDLEKHGLGTIKGGTLYPLLVRYEAAGLVVTEWRPGEAGPGRKYFALTEHGRAELECLRPEWARFAEISNDYLGATQPRKENIA